MTAKEARNKLDFVLAQKSVARFFPLIEQAIVNGLNCITVMKKGITSQEINVLKNDYGYTITPNEDDSGDYHRSSKTVSYNITW